MANKTLLATVLAGSMLLPGCASLKAFLKHNHLKEYETFSYYSEKDYNLYRSNTRSNDFFDYDENRICDLTEISDYVLVNGEISVVATPDGSQTYIAHGLDVPVNIFTDPLEITVAVIEAEGNLTKEEKKKYPQFVLNINHETGMLTYYDAQIDGLNDPEDEVEWFDKTTGFIEYFIVINSPEMEEYFNEFYTKMVINAWESIKTQESNKDSNEN